MSEQEREREREEREEQAVSQSGALTISTLLPVVRVVIELSISNDYYNSSSSSSSSSSILTSLPVRLVMVTTTVLLDQALWAVTEGLSAAVAAAAASW